MPDFWNLLNKFKEALIERRIRQLEERAKSLTMKANQLSKDVELMMSILENRN